MSRWDNSGRTFWVGWTRFHHHEIEPKWNIQPWEKSAPSIEVPWPWFTHMLSSVHSLHSLFGIRYNSGLWSIAGWRYIPTIIYHNPPHSIPVSPLWLFTGSAKWMTTLFIELTEHTSFGNTISVVKQRDWSIFIQTNRSKTLIVDRKRKPKWDILLHTPVVIKLFSVVSLKY